MLHRFHLPETDRKSKLEWIEALRLSWGIVAIGEVSAKEQRRLDRTGNSKADSFAASSSPAIVFYSEQLRPLDSFGRTNPNHSCYGVVALLYDTPSIEKKNISSNFSFGDLSMPLPILQDSR